MSQEAVRVVTSGTYQRELVDTSFAWQAGTEVEETVMSTYITATTKDELFSWIRYNVAVFGQGAAGVLFEYAVFRCKSADATQDMNDSDAMEYLQKEGRILTRGIVSQGDWAAGLSSKLLKMEFFNVKIPDDEELRFLIRPIFPAGPYANSRIIGLLEYRKVGA